MIRPLVLLFALISFSTSYSQQLNFQELADSLRIAGNFPGLSVAVIKADNTLITVTSGYNDIEEQSKLKPDDRLLQGSVGKTYAAAVALQLIQEGKIKLDEKVAVYLGHHDWYRRLPNAETITVRMIMQHTSGIMRYEFKEKFTNDLVENPDKTWKPEDLLSYVFDEKAPFAAGEGWDYSDTNFILLGMIMEKVTGKKYYDLLKSRVLIPLKLTNTFPSDSRRLAGLAQGYAGNENAFGKKDKMIGADGQFIINPQFEWTGGGIYATTGDLARWGKLLYESKAFDTSMTRMMITTAVPAKLGRDVKYGLGVIIRNTSKGVAYGHSGFFPGYLTEMLYFPDHKICIAVQANSSDFKKIKFSVLRALLTIADGLVD